MPSIKIAIVYHSGYGQPMGRLGDGVSTIQ